ncbi:MAG: anti-sigma factor family protein [Candidatus Promineifilaceae bacterium]|jgi:anti-sigma factor RsiW
MDHNDIFALMMDMLDGEASESEARTLEAHLRACPECEQEWRALVAIDTLFRQTPALSPAADFVEKTLARLPNRRARIWAMGAIYSAILLGGLIPLAMLGYLGYKLLPVLSQPALIGSVLKSLGTTYHAASVIMGALASGAGEALVQQPVYVGLMMVVAGIIFLWGGVYRRLVMTEV